jgi:hypothetical protein
MAGGRNKKTIAELPGGYAEAAEWGISDDVTENRSLLTVTC